MIFPGAYRSPGSRYGAFAGALVLFAAAGEWAYGLAFADSLRWVLGVLLLYYIPGHLLVRVMRLRVSFWLTHPVVSLAVGLVVIPAIYRFLRQLEVADIYGAGLVAVLAAYSIFLLMRRRPLTGTSGRPCLADLIGLMLLLAFIIVTLHFSHFTDVILNETGFHYRVTHMTESAYHLGLVNALSAGYPPPALYASGGPDFSYYHLDMHLQTEALVRYFGLDALHLVTFYMPLLYFSLLALLPFVLVREAGGATLTAVVCGALIFGGDFSYIPAWLLDPDPGFAWTVYFQPTIWGLFTLNGFLPALIALFVAFFLLRDYLQRGEIRSLLLFSVITYCSVGFKSTMGLHLGAAALLTGVMMVMGGASRRRGWHLIVASSTALVAVLIDLVVLRSGVGDSVVALAPLNLFMATLQRLGMSALDVTWYLPMAAVFLAGALGVRVLALEHVRRNIIAPASRDWSLVFVAIFFVCGYLVAEMTFIGKTAGINNSSWFYGQSLMLAWFPLFLWLVELQQRPRVYYISILVAVLLAAPTTIQFLRLRDDPRYVGFGRDELALVDYLRHTDPGSVVLHPINTGMPALASNFAGRPSVLNVWVSFVTESEGLSERVQNVEYFFDPGTESSGRLKILQRYGVKYVYGTDPALSFMRELPTAELVLRSGHLVLYKIHGP